MDAFETVAERDGFAVKIYHDTAPLIPDDWDNLATMEHSAPFTFGEPQRYEPERGWHVYARWLTLSGEAAAAFAIRIDEERGVVSFYETDDDHANGVLYTTHKRVTELCGDGAEYHTRAWIEDALREELAAWKQYGEGDVWGYVVEDDNGNNVDSCWGFYGLEYAREEAADALNYAVEAAAKRRIQIAQGWAIAHGLGSH